jgi:signal transduction histidine kinase/ligand-binding sensor domain-containing protein
MQRLMRVVVLRVANHNLILPTIQIALLVAALCVSATDSAAQRLPIRTYTTADGLPRDYVSRIRQDSKGFLWFCTNEGVSRFDGYKFTNYGTDQGLADLAVRDLLEARDGTYWVATEKGICRFIQDPLPPGKAGAPAQRFVVYYPGQKSGQRQVNVLCQDRSGAIWCGTEGGLFRLDQVNGIPVFSFEDITAPANGGDHVRIDAIMEDRSGSLWVVAGAGLYRRRPDGVVERYTAAEGLPEQHSTSLLEDRQGRIWVGSDLGLCLLVPDPVPHRPVVARRFTASDGLSNGAVKTLLQSADGKLWVGTSMGLSESLTGQGEESQRFKTHTKLDGLSSEEIAALAEDQAHNIWIGVISGGGLMRLAANGFATFREADGLGGIRIASIFEDRAGQLCVLSSDRFVTMFDHGKARAVQLKLPKGVKNWNWGWYQTTFQDSAGEWWMDTGDGLLRYPRLANLAATAGTRPKAIYRVKDGLPADMIFRLFEDSRGDIWISTLHTRGDLTRWERATGTFHTYSFSIGVPDSAATAFCEVGGDLWIGFYGGGLMRYRDGHFTPFSNADGVPPGVVRGLYADHAGRLWIATGEGGVVRSDDPAADRPHFVAYSEADGLSSNMTTCITENQWGMIYVGTGRGLDELDPATGRIRHYTTADGLAGSFINVSFRDHDGSLWFGTLQGLSRLIPRPEPVGSPPPILITGLEIAGVPYPTSELGAASIGGIKLGPSQNHIQIDFAGLSLAAGASLQYQYKLEGAYSDWSAPTDQREISYPNLPPGSYRFLVRAVDSNGILSEAPAAVSFNILPPVWQRWWFHLLALALAALPIAAFLRYRRQRLKAIREAEIALRKSREERLVELEKVRKRIATDLHDDIGSSLSLIHLFSEVVRERIDSNDAEVAGPLKIISTSSQEILGSMSDIVWAINPQKDHLSDLSQRMRRLASDAFAAGEIAFDFHAPERQADVRLGADVRREVFLIFKETVNNLVKHSGCSRVGIEFDVSNDALLLTVQDDGRGFDTRKENEGHGLLSIAERAKSLGGQLDIVSTQGRGTTVTLRVRLTNPSY